MVLFLPLIVFSFVYLFAIVYIIVTIIRKIIDGVKNLILPNLTVDATMITKRIPYDRRVYSNSMKASSIDYEENFATFEFENGDRLEFSIVQREYGLLREGDFGKLTFHGTEFISFERIKESVENKKQF